MLENISYTLKLPPLAPGYYLSYITFSFKKVIADLSQKYSHCLFLTLPKSLYCVYVKRNGYSWRLGSHQEGKSWGVFIRTFFFLDMRAVFIFLYLLFCFPITTASLFPIKKMRCYNIIFFKGKRGIGKEKTRK